MPPWETFALFGKPFALFARRAGVLVAVATVVSRFPLSAPVSTLQ